MSPVWLNWFLVVQYVVLAGWYLIDSKSVKSVYWVKAAILGSSVAVMR